MLIVCFAAFNLSAQDYYVSASLGNDSNGGTENAPFATINKGIAEVSAGGTVFVMEGEYRDESAGTPVVSFYEDTTGQVDSAGNNYVYSSGSNLNNPHVVTINKAGNAVDGYITLKNYSNHTPKIIFNGQGGIKLGANANYVIVEGFEVEGPSQSINYTQAIMNRRNRITLNEGQGIKNNNLSYFSGKGIWGGYDAHHHIIIRNNIVHDTPGSGIRFNDSDHITIENNNVYNTTWWTSSASSAIVFAETIATTDEENTTDIKMIMRGNTVYNNWNRIPFYMASLPENGQPPSEKYGAADYATILDGQGLYATRSHSPSDTNPRPGYVGTFLFENNLCVNNGKNGINFDRSNYSSAIIRNNTIYFNGVHEIIQNISVSEGNPRHGGQKVAGIIANFVYNVTVANNIVVTRSSDYSALKLNNVDNPSTESINNDGTKIATNNIFLNGTVAYPGNQVPANQINVDPLFVNAPTLTDDATTITGWTGYLYGTDFSLQQNSPAINAGSSGYSPALDINKNPRPVIPENVISSTSFELDNGGWYNFGNITVAQSDETAKTGSKSLKTSGRTANYHSPRIFLNDLLTVGETYTFYVWVKLAEGSGTVQLTVKSTVNGATAEENVDTYTNLASATATANDWVLLTDNFTHTQNDQSFMYVKGPVVSGGTGVDYFVDDFSLVSEGADEVDFTNTGNVVDIGAYEYQPQQLSTTENPSQATAVYAYPNPTKDMLTLINLTDEEGVEVYDVLGRKLAIQQQRNANSLKLNVSKLDTGIYFINVSNNNGETKSIRFIKK
ncbi:T9SS type A sorting domain-containing protein [Flavobacteriaceae bacterium]|nr:T9SS type A sorting domain-containing protein [Flavobacteriaceae bacterium]